MNKVASYLNEHLLGEVSNARALRAHFSTDASVLSITPENVAFPRVTNDIRKIARFTWQLAEKGHAIGITARGFGLDTTGGAIGKGIIINTAPYLNSILQILPKDRLVHAQPGVSVSTLQQALRWNGLTVPSTTNDVSLGGAIAGDALGDNKALSDSIEKLEVILANGDVIETGRINKRELSKKLGLQTFEGEIYRKLEGVIEDNQELIDRLAKDRVRDNTGYARIADVRAKDGSFDLTPLFIGSQGTLGIISEIVLQTDFYAQDETLVALTTDTFASARDIADRILDLDPATLTIYDGALYRRATAHGTRFSLIGDVDQLGAVVYVRFNDFNDRTRSHKLKKLRKMLKNTSTGIVSSDERPGDDFIEVRSAASYQLLSEKEGSDLPIINGAYVPEDRREEFEHAVSELSASQHIDLPLLLNIRTGTYDLFPELKLSVVSDKQKLFRLITDYSALVHIHNGACVSDGAEGRLKANATWATLDDDEIALYEAVRSIFDPFSTLNPGVKQRNELRSLVSSLRSSYDQLNYLV